MLLKSYAAEEIQAIATYGKEDINFEEFPEVFSRMSKLRLLIIDGQHIPNALNHVPNDLRYLQWSFCSLKCLPSSFQPKKLVQFDLQCSKFEYLWEEVMVNFVLLTVFLLFTISPFFKYSSKCICLLVKLISIFNESSFFIFYFFGNSIQSS